jgi:hypothetical protein
LLEFDQHGLVSRMIGSGRGSTRGQTIRAGNVTIYPAKSEANARLFGIGWGFCRRCGVKCVVAGQINGQLICTNCAALPIEEPCHKSPRHHDDSTQQAPEVSLSGGTSVVKEGPDGLDDWREETGL